jgi:HPt (histidine-containing phosphotransfer) domain-containing protein
MLAGGNGVLNRPIVPVVWRQALAIYLPAEDDASPNESMTMIQSSLEHDREFMTLVRTFVAKLPALLAEMRAALQVADLAHLIKKVHALADSGQLYGYSALAAEAQRLEESILHGRDTPTFSTLLDSLETLIRSIDRGIKFGRSAGTIALPGPLTIAA